MPDPAESTCFLMDRVSATVFHPLCTSRLFTPQPQKVFVDGLNPKVNRPQYMQMLDEEEVARKNGTPWQLRGPPNPDDVGPDGKPPLWRGQRWRPLSQKWTNRGGKNKEYFGWKYGHGKTPYARNSQKEQARAIAEKHGLTVVDKDEDASSSWQGGASSSWQEGSASSWWRSDDSWQGSASGWWQDDDKWGGWEPDGDK